MFYEEEYEGWEGPASFEEYEARNIRELTGAMAQDVLKAHGFAGRSKLKADEAMREAMRIDPEACMSARIAKSRFFRWPVAHGMHVSYGQLEQAEKAAGVVPVMNSKSKRGEYASLDDVRAVYAALEASAAGAAASMRARLVFDEADKPEARSIIEMMRAAFDVSAVDEHEMRNGGRAFYFDVLVPKE